MMTTKKASLNRKAYLQSTLYLEKNLKLDLKISIQKVKQLIEPLRYQSGLSPLAKLTPLLQ